MFAGGAYLGLVLEEGCLCGHRVSWHGSPLLQQQFRPILPMFSTVPPLAVNASYNAAQDAIFPLSYRGTLPLN